MYLRAIVNGNSSISPVKVISNDKEEELIPQIYGYRGFKEGGVYLEIPAEKVVAIVFKWEVNIENKDQYNFGVQIQPGLSQINNQLIVRFDKENYSSYTDGVTLTKEGNYLYNTSLLDDIVVSFRRNNE